MEVAHFGSYSLHLAGIRTVDRLVSELWNLVQTLPGYQGKTTLMVLPEFGRDLDGSTTNGFFNHRQDNDSTRLTWMMCLGDAVRTAQVIEHPTDQTDICPTIAQLFGIKGMDLPGRSLPGLWL
jgi:membrane-anchored protein YejM (alkaline phosphatase superfamily)